MQQDLSRLREENRLLRTPAIPQVVQAPRRAAFTSTKVPRFDRTTSWEQYRQVFDAIVWSKDNDTAALQLFSHLEGEALNLAHLVPLSRQLSRSGLVDALTTHYGSPGRLADYRRQFERTTRTVGEDPAIFATELETLAIKAFGDMGQTTRLRLIRDRFIAGHSSCELRRHLDSVPPETPIRDVVDRCRVWESHADPAARLVSRIRSIQPMLSEMPTGPVRSQEWRQSPDRDQARINWRIYFHPSVNYNHGISGPDARGAGSGKVVTANGGGNTELSTSGCEFSSTDGIRTNDALFLSGTALETATAAATAIRPTSLE